MALLISVVSAGSSEGSGKPRNVEMSRTVHNQAGKVFPQIVPVAERGMLQHVCVAKRISSALLPDFQQAPLSGNPSLLQGTRIHRRTMFGLQRRASSLFSAQGSGRRRTLELSGNTKPSEGLPLAAKRGHKNNDNPIEPFLAPMVPKPTASGNA